MHFRAMVFLEPPQGFRGEVVLPRPLGAPLPMCIAHTGAGPGPPSSKQAKQRRQAQTLFSTNSLQVVLDQKGCALSNGRPRPLPSSLQRSSATDAPRVVLPLLSPLTSSLVRRSSQKNTAHSGPANERVADCLGTKSADPTPWGEA